MEEEQLYDGEFELDEDDVQLDADEEQDFYDEDESGGQEFDEDGEGNAMDEEDDDLIDAPIGSEAKSSRAKPVEDKEQVQLTEQFFNKLTTQLDRKPGMGSLRLFLQIFVDLMNEEQTDRFRKRAYLVSDLELLNKIIRYGVETYPGILIKVAGMKIDEDSVVLKKEKYAVLLKTLCNNFAKFLGQQTTAEMTIYLAKSIRQNIGIFRISLQKALKLVLACLQQWGGSDDLGAKLETLLVIRDICSFVDSQHYEKILKKAFLTFAEYCKQVTWRNYDLVSFMVNGLTELYRVKPTISYILAFNVLQGLAGRVHALFTSNDAEKIKKLYNWKTLNTLRFLTHSVCQMSREGTDYAQLVYPLVEVLRATATLFPAVQYFPIRIHLLRLLVTVGTECRINIPLFPLFLPMFRTQHFLQRKKYGNSKSVADAEVTIKIAKDALQSHDLWEGVVREVCNLLLRYVASQEGSRSFLEHAVLIYRHLNSVRKLTGNPVVRNELKTVLTLIKQAASENVRGRKGIQKVGDEGRFVVPNLLREESERREADRKAMIKMKVLAEKEEMDDGEGEEEGESLNVEDEDEEEFDQ